MPDNRRKSAVAAVIAYLNGVLSVPAYGGVPAARPTEFVDVRRTGGVRRNIVTDAPWITCGCWATDSARAEALANEVADALEDSVRAYVKWTDDDGREQRAWITSYTEVGGPAHNPDDASERYTLTVELGVSTNA